MAVEQAASSLLTERNNNKEDLTMDTPGRQGLLAKLPLYQCEESGNRKKMGSFLPEI